MVKSHQKLFFIGLSLAHAATDETGIAIINNDLQIIRIDKAYKLNDIKFFLNNLSGKNASIIAADIPLNQLFLIGKWRQELKHYKPLTIGNHTQSTQEWAKRQSTRGSEFCAELVEEGYEVIRYNYMYSKTAMGLCTPLQENSPMACKYLQERIKEKLGIEGFSNNMLSMPALKAIIGAYIAWQTHYGTIDQDYRQITEFENLPVYSGI